MKLLNALTETAVDGGVIKETFFTTALRKSSVSLCRGNAVLYKRSLTVMACASGIAFQQGMLMPSGMSLETALCFMYALHEHENVLFS